MGLEYSEYRRCLSSLARWLADQRLRHGIRSAPVRRRWMIVVTALVPTVILLLGLGFAASMEHPKLKPAGRESRKRYASFLPPCNYPR